MQTAWRKEHSICIQRLLQQNIELSTTLPTWPDGDFQESLQGASDLEPPYYRPPAGFGIENR